MEPWLEDLSEEWIPQPRTSSPVPESANTSSAPKESSAQPSQLRSRLPRFRTSSGSFSDIKTRPLSNGKRRNDVGRSALAVRSLSDNNISFTASAVENSPHSTSVLSPHSVVYQGTVEQRPIKASPEKGHEIQDTPEWKRRLVRGQLGYGEQRDLFSPMGLENIFQKPSGPRAKDAKSSTKGLRLFKGLDAMPSSPPPWPSDEKPLQEGQRKLSSGSQEEARTHGKTQHHQEIGAPAYRTVSGQVEFENENFSPVFISKQNSMNGQVDYVAPSFSRSEINARLRNLGLPSDDTIQSSICDPAQADKVDESSYAKFQEDTLPEDLPVGTPSAIDIGGFVSARRGGYSADGSFRRRPLSPSPQAKGCDDSAVRNRSVTNDTSNFQESDSVIIRPQAPTPPSATPITPHRQRQSEFLSPERTRSSGSPLKLFDNHDTFTSNRLHRRLSQLEERTGQLPTNERQTIESESPKKFVMNTRLTSVEEVSIHKTAFETRIVSQTPPARIRDTRRETFGEGDLDNYQFPEGLSMTSSQQSLKNDSDGMDGSPASDVAPPGFQQPSQFKLESPPSMSDGKSVRRKGSRTSSKHYTLGQRKISQNSYGLPLRDEYNYNGSKADAPQQQPSEVAEGKRPPTSPFKNPTPKRRRTINAVELDENHSLDSSAKEMHVAMQSVIGKKRKDARQDQSNNIADPEVLSRRHILRPRNPTPSQRRRDELQAEILEATEAFLLSSPRLGVIQEQLKSPIANMQSPEPSQAKVVAGEVAAFTMQKMKAMKNDSRKRSVTTQDFLDEAVKIMEFIRTKGRPTSGLASLEETESESLSRVEDDPIPSTPLTFSRPPSREGATSGWRMPNRQQLDPQVMSHLQKFQDKDSDDFMASSVRSLHFERGQPTVEPQESRTTVEQNNIRITEASRRKRADSDLSKGNDKSIGSGSGTAGTHQTTESSFGRTAVTNTSRRSDHVATLAPEAVAHLIPEQIAGMSFDRDRGIWIKSKSPVKEVRRTEEVSTLNESEDDPFGDIPDLTVDEMRELMMKRDAKEEGGKVAEGVRAQVHRSQEHSVPDKSRPTTREGKAIAPTESSSVPSKFSNFAWSFPKTETRATSWSEPEAEFDSTKVQQQATPYTTADDVQEEVEHEIRFDEGRAASPGTKQAPRLRDITISFSSPCVSGADTLDEPDKDNADGSDPHYLRPDTDQTRGYPKPHSSSHEVRTTQRTSKSSYRGAWRNGTGTKPFLAPTVPPIEEDGDLSILPEPTRNYRMQLSMSLSAPVVSKNERDDALTAAPPTPSRVGDVTFMLSDLPDFTINQIDERELPDRVLVKRNGTGSSLEDRYAQGTADLVRALQDVEPDELYWEDLREVDIHQKGLTNIHRLEEFCYRIEDLDVSNNDIYQLAGVPSSVRRLRAQNNALSTLTSWSHLGNLQHLDISDNDIDSLKGIRGLLHLRTLKADNNKIHCLDGILELDGLMELSVRGNEIKEVDFDFANLKSLLNLNMAGNGIVEIRNVQCLPQLRHLDLDDNCIRAFPVSDIASSSCGALRSLRLCRNGMEFLDVSTNFPSLESLYVDNNCLAEVVGLNRLRRLRTLSAREQLFECSGEPEVNQLSLQQADIRTLYISANSLPTFHISHDFLNLQRLELASSGLQSLPDNFGQLAPNLRHLNLNFNALKDLRPLLNIKRLNELLVAGNRLSKLRTNFAVLGKLSSLTQLDLRENPLTIGFYAPVVENRVMSLRKRPCEDEEPERFVLPAGIEEADQQYLARLDDDTRLRRRVHEMMLATSMRHLRELDGLPFDSRAAMVKDEIWERLVLLGVIRKTPTDHSLCDGSL